MSLPFQTPQQIIADPVSLFAHEPNTGINKSLFLTDIMLNEDIIIEANHYIGILCSFFITGQLYYRASPCVIDYFSHSLSQGVIPAAIIPIYKSGDKTVPSNYRPISLTSVICKVLERIQIQNLFLTAQSTQIKSVISVPIKDFIHHYPRALFNDIPRVGTYFYDIPGSGHTFMTYPGRGAV